MLSIKNQLSKIQVFIFLFSGFQLSAQINPGRIELLLDNTTTIQGLANIKEVREFYKSNGYHTYWLKPDGVNIRILTNLIIDTPNLGLIQTDYQPGLFENPGIKLLSEKDSITAEIKYTDAAIHFLHDVLMGNDEDRLGYNGLHYTPSCYDIPTLLNIYLTEGRLQYVLSEMESKDLFYTAVKSKLLTFRGKRSDKNFVDEVITKSVTTNNQPFLHRLFQLGLVQTEALALTEPDWKLKIKEVQDMFGLLDNGVVDASTLQAINVPLDIRIQQLAYTLNTIRWLSCINRSAYTLIINIPSATLLLFENGKPILESRIIAGKKTTPTSTLCSKINEVILYPYWHVPHTIATKELLPIFKRNPSYVEAGNYQVLNERGNLVKSSAINWKSLSVNNFPYTIRQSTGCDNALGLIKLEFENPFTIYLHDTPIKILFSSSKRFYSHGCMRLERAMEVGRYILKGNTIAIDTLDVKACLKSQSPIIVPASEHIPVFVLYNTVWADSYGTVHFYEDIYDKKPWVNKNEYSR